MFATILRIFCLSRLLSKNGRGTTCHQKKKYFNLMCFKTVRRENMKT